MHKKVINDLLNLNTLEALQIINKKWPHNSKELISYLADLHYINNNYEYALILYKNLIDLDENNIDLIKKIAFTSYLFGNYEDALIYARKANKLIPTNHKVSKLYLDCLLILGYSEELELQSTKLANNYPNDHEFRYALALTKRLSGDFITSIEILNSLLISTKNSVYQMALADTIGETNSKSAIIIYESLITNGLELSTIQKYNLSIHYLRIRNFTKGWDYFEYGLDKLTGKHGRVLPYNLKDTIKIESFKLYKKEIKVLVCSEQGIGDQIIFLSAINDALIEFPNLYMICENRMINILKRTFPSVKFSSNGNFDDFNINNISITDSIGYLPLGTLFSRFRPTLKSILSNKNIFLKSNEEFNNKFIDFLNTIANGRKIIGICWKSNAPMNIQKIKNTEFMDWLPLFTKDVLIVNLQYGDTYHEQEMVKNLGLEMISFNQFDFSKDIDAWISLSNACDGIVSISSSIVHFAGAIGKKVSVVVPHNQGHWSIGIDESASILYPFVRIFRKYDFLNDSSLLIDAVNFLKKN